MIAVIISQYHHEHLLPDAIQSIFNQTFPDLKVYLFNDDPRTNLDAYEYCHGGVVVYDDRENKGQAARFNQGIQCAIEDGCSHVCFLGADDMMMPWRLMVMMRAFELFRDADVLYSDFVQVNGNGYKTYIKTREFDIDLLKQKNYIAAGTVLVKFRDYDFPLFDKTLMYGEDWHWYHQLHGKGFKFKYVPMPTLWYRTGYSVIGIDPIKRDEVRNKIMGMY